MANDGRVRLIKALKVSYWKQFEHGMLSREAVQALINLADTAMDEEGRWKLGGLIYLKTSMALKYLSLIDKARKRT